MAERLKEAGLAPIAFPLGHAVGDGNDFNYSVLWSHGASDVAADGKTVAIDSAETRAALEYMLRLFSVMPADTLSYDDAVNNRAATGSQHTTSSRGLCESLGPRLAPCPSRFCSTAQPRGTLT